TGRKSTGVPTLKRTEARAPVFMRWLLNTKGANKASQDEVRSFLLGKRCHTECVHFDRISALFPSAPRPSSWANVFTAGSTFLSAAFKPLYPKPPRRANPAALKFPA